MMIADLSRISSPYLRKRAAEIVAMVDKELGAAAPEPEAGQMRTALFLYIHNKRVVGCVICTKIKSAVLVSVPPSPPIASRQLVLRTPSPPSSTALSQKKSPKENSSPDTVATDLRRLDNNSNNDSSSSKVPSTKSESTSAPASIGISRIWVGVLGVRLMFLGKWFHV